MVKVTGRAAYLQIADELRSKIESGTLPGGAILKSQSQLMAEYGVSNTVVKAALQVLRNEGLIVGQVGKGVYVREEKVAPSAPGTADLAVVLERLDEVNASLQELTARVAALENAPSTPERLSRPTRKSATSARRSAQPPR